MAKHENIEDFVAELSAAVADAVRQGEDVSGMVAKVSPAEEGPELGLKKKVWVCFDVPFKKDPVCLWRWIID